MRHTPEPLRGTRAPPSLAPAFVPPIVHETLREPGQPLDSGVRAWMEPRFGHDFSQVRVHSGEQAAASARAVHARAYTVGHDIVLGAGEYAPGTREGHRLLAHELTHVLQQRGRTPGMQKQDFGEEPASAAEGEAEQVASEVMGEGGQEALVPGESSAEPMTENSRCLADHPRLPFSGTFSAEGGVGHLPIFCVTRPNVQIRIRGDWVEQIPNPEDRPPDQRNRRPDRPRFFLTMHGWWIGGSHVTTADITPGVERTLNFTAIEPAGYRVEINCFDPQRNRVLTGPFSISES